jgi:hypothetical protein
MSRELSFEIFSDCEKLKKIYIYLILSAVLSAGKAHCKEIGRKGKGIPVTSRVGPQGCEASRFTYLVDNRLIDGGESTLWP